jgi:hypothetical protein
MGIDVEEIQAKAIHDIVHKMIAENLPNLDK